MVKNSLRKACLINNLSVRCQVGHSQHSWHVIDISYASILALRMELDPSTVKLRSLAIGDAGWLIQRHAELYAEAEGFDRSFEPLVAEILTGFLRNHDPSTERGFIADAEGMRLGSIFCVQAGEPGVAKLRLFFLEPKARGLGLGQRLLDACLGFAKDTGYRKMTLWTHESHRAACALYAKNGFRLTEERPVHSFGVGLVEQSWAIDLA